MEEEGGKGEEKKEGRKERKEGGKGKEGKEREGWGEEGGERGRRVGRTVGAYQVVQVGPGVIDTLECLHDNSAGLVGFILNESDALLLHPLHLLLFLLHLLLHFLYNNNNISYYYYY